jgi:hypothetical protein
MTFITICLLPTDKAILALIFENFCINNVQGMVNSRFSTGADWHCQLGASDGSRYVGRRGPP